MTEQFYNVNTVAKMFDVEPHTIRTWIRQDKIKAQKILGRWRVPQSEIDQLVKKEFG